MGSMSIYTKCKKKQNNNNPAVLWQEICEEAWKQHIIVLELFLSHRFLLAINSFNSSSFPTGRYVRSLCLLSDKSLLWGFSGRKLPENGEIPSFRPETSGAAGPGCPPPLRLYSPEHAEDPLQGPESLRHINEKEKEELYPPKHPEIWVRGTEMLETKPPLKK